MIQKKEIVERLRKVADRIDGDNYKFDYVVSCDRTILSSLGESRTVRNQHDIHITTDMGEIQMKFNIMNTEKR